MIRAAALAAALCCGCSLAAVADGGADGGAPGDAAPAPDQAQPQDLAFIATDACAGVAAASLSGDVQPILSAHCAGIECHSSLLAQGRTWRYTYRMPAPECQGRSYIEPGNPPASYLYDKVTGTDLCYGNRMPLNRAPLGDDEIALIAGWICAGAPND